MIQKIVVGGQAGAEIAAAEAAISCGVPYGGWLPKGRKTENGPVPEKYTEFKTVDGGYAVRTEQNIINSDGTLIFTYAKLCPSNDSTLPKKIATQHNRPFLIVDLASGKNPASKIADWIIEWDIHILNVTGEKASKAPGIYDQVKNIISNLLTS